MRQQTIERHKWIRQLIEEECQNNPNATATDIYYAVAKKTHFAFITIRNIANNNQKGSK